VPESGPLGSVRGARSNARPYRDPVGGPDAIRITTSRGQGQAREGLSEGSPSAKVRADGQKSHRRLSSGASQHKMTKPAMSKGRVNAAVVH
jgi:hypothetical protein